MDTFIHMTELASAVGLGLLVGLERERRKGEGADRRFAGLRTFTLTALLGYVSMLLGDVTLLAAMTLAVALLASTAYIKRRGQDPGVTTGVALLLVLLLGGLCNSEAPLAVALAVILTLFLNYRQSLHRFALNQLSEVEIRDGLTLATAALVIMPLVPNEYIGPYQAINPRSICLFTVLIMAMGALGHIAVRVLGVRYGLTVTAIATGFVSGTATIATLGGRARQQGEIARPAANAAILSNLATLIQLSIILAAISPAALSRLWLALLMTTLVILLFALAPMIRETGTVEGTLKIGHAFNLKMALLVALGISALFFMTSVMRVWFGVSGLYVASLLGGLADVHAASASVAALVKSGQLTAVGASLPILLAFSTNTLSKCVLAWSSGGMRFARRVIPAQMLILATLWVGTWLQDWLLPG
ncbi:MgtC/SapB family protein [Pseudomonas gingeri]